jgi:hypothetical protein
MCSWSTIHFLAGFLSLKHLAVINELDPSQLPEMLVVFFVLLKRWAVPAMGWYSNIYNG